jgi:hypothetical protein
MSGVQVIAKNAGILLTAYQSTDVAGSEIGLLEHASH